MKIILSAFVGYLLATSSSLANYTISIPTGIHPIANLLNNGGNTLQEVLPGIPNGTVIEKWNCTGYTTNTMVAGVWTPAGATLKPGEGAFIVNNSGASFNVTFTGTPPVPVLPPPLPCGCGQLNFLACQTNEIGTFENIMGFPPPDGAQVYVYNNGGFSVTTFDQFSQAWSPFDPALQPGQPAFFKIPACSTAPSMTCATNKTVSGCSAWNFDSPTNIIVNCYTNYPLTFSTVTNSGPCPLVTTRTWLITDICGNTNSCSQTVTVNCCTNCCADCTTNNFITNTVTVNPGYNYLVNPLCHGTNNTVGVLLPNVPDGTDLLKWDTASQSYGPVLTFDSASGGWVDNSTFSDASGVTLDSGQGFVLQNPDGPYTLTWTGCLPTCPLPCLPKTNGLSVLVGGFGLGTATWTNLSSCPPICGTRVSIWNGSGFDNFDFFNGGWIPQAPVLQPGSSAFVSFVANTNCLPCTNNLVVNGGFETPLVTGPFSFFTNGAVPGWKGYDGSCNSGTAADIELWPAGASIPPAEGSQDLEISSSVANETVCQTVTNLTPGCPANFCFMYTGRPGIDGSTGQPYDNNFTVTLSGGYALSVPLDPPAYNANGSGWQYYCTSFVPSSSTLTIAFSRQPTTGDVGGAHIDKVTLTQCCPTNPCATPPTLTCASNKTVVCGSTWTFDPPTATPSCCGTNLTIAVLGMVTNGVCPKVITRTWVVTDTCGNSNTCSQVVTVVSCVPPPSGMVGWWPLDETSGTTVAEIANGFNGTASPGPIGPIATPNGPAPAILWPPVVAAGGPKVGGAFYFWHQFDNDLCACRTTMP